MFRMFCQTNRISHTLFQNNGMFGLMRKNLLCMCVGVGASLIGIQSNYYDKLAIFYSSHRYQELRNMIVADWKMEKQSEKDDRKSFVQVKHS